MAQKLEQQQTEAQVQSLNTVQVALARLLELPLIDLQQRVQNEMLENSALEEADGSEAETPDNNEDETDRTDTDDAYTQEAERDNEMSEMDDYLTADDVPAYLQERADAQRERHEIPVTEGRSFYESLQEQIGEHNLTEHEREVMDYLIGSLDNDGFLRKDLPTLCDELAIYNNIETSESELAKLLGVLQGFEPRGIGARSLQECLLLQLEDPELQSPHKAAAIDIVRHHFKAFTSKHWETLRHRLALDETTFERTLSLLTHLNPSPGSAFGESLSVAAPTVIPDFYVHVDDDGEPHVSLNNDGVPELRVSRAFRDSIREYVTNRKNLSRTQRDAYLYARQKVEAAQSFINIVQRRRQTLFAVMTVIVELQRPFFVEDDDETLLVPMTLRDVAERIGVDISTVSRVTGSKYVQTAYGVYPLKYFFSNQFTTDSGEELSARQAKLALRELLESEDAAAPLSDEALSKALKEKGFPIARRTVAKYREQLGFAVQRLRRGRA